MSDYQTLLVASLLHDIGKFWQRTGESHGPRYAPYGPEDYGRHGAHAKWSAETIERFFPTWTAAIQPVLRHHAPPQDRLTQLVTLADRLSAAERDDSESDTPRTAVTGGVKTRSGQRQLVSVFTRLQLDGLQPPPPAYWPLTPLRLEPAVLFPIKQPVTEDQERVHYRQLWEAFTNELRKLPQALDFPARFVTLVHLLARFCWCIPSAYFQQATPDISLYDHLRSTCALAAALHQAQLSDQTLQALLAQRVPEWEQPCLTLIAADITGVQRFLYTLTAARAARSLRGRSFFLQLVTEAIGRWLLRQLDLPLVNLLYAGGGRCYLLTQFLSDDALTTLRQQLDRILLTTTDGELYVALAARPLSCADLSVPERFRTAWTQLHESLQAFKGRKFADLPAEELAQNLFAPRGIGGPEPPCAICRREAPVARLEDDERICARCDSFIDLGSELRRARWLFLREIDPVVPRTPREQAHYRGLLAALGLELHLIANDAQLERLVALGRGTLLRVDDPDFLTPPALEIAKQSGSIGLGFAFLANVVPVERDGSVMEFETIAASGPGARGLGILRMDVDDLGRLFALGLGEQLSLSRLASLSGGLRLFFEGYLATRARQYNDQQKPLYLVYSGGDDVFAVGHWHTIAHFALELRNDFRSFTSGNPVLHLSAGVALVPEHAPLYQAAEEAKEALEAAKARSENGRVVKNAITFLGRTLDWSQFEQVTKEVRELAQLIEHDLLPRSLLQNLAAVGLLYDQARTEAMWRGTLRPGQLVYGRWLWLATYLLSRARERLADSSPAAAHLAKLQHDLRDPALAERLRLVARWTQLVTRREDVG
uniref:CRISPR system single-strand-specific deoxyribonuclease Cas10/Csm1 (subtype III-A) n=1 Tax=Thermomicrobium roseum TaxID=500 RepID=A0A7C5VY60_THERO